MKAVNIIYIIIFLLSAALQYNDPDPFVWIAIYLFAAVLCYQSINGKYVPALYWLGFIIYAAYAAYLFFDDMGVQSWWNEHQAENIAQSMKAEKPWIEETREFGGLLICISSLIVNTIFRKRILISKK